MLAVGVVGCGQCDRPPGDGADEQANLHRNLVEAFGQRRPLLARLSGFDDWRPCSADESPLGVCAPALDPSFLELEQLTTIGSQLRSEESRRSPEAQHVRALWYLIWAPQDNAARAAALLEEVILARPTDEAATGDRMAALITAGLTGSDPREYAAALESGAPGRPSGSYALRFNQALSLELLGLFEEALEGWSALAADERRPGWGDEALARAEGLELARSRTEGVVPAAQALLRAQSELLAEWADAVLAGQGERVDKALAGLRATQQRLAAGSADRSLEELARALAAAGASAPSIARGVHAYLDGVDRLRRFDLAGAAAALRQAELGLDPVPALAAWTLYQRSVVAYQHGSAQHYGLAHRLLDAALERLGGLSSTLLRGRVHYQRALLAGVRGDHQSALSCAAAAREALEAAGDKASLSRLEELVAHESRLLGQRRNAWRGAHAALLAAQAIDSQSGRFSALFSLAALARDEGWHRAELVFADALLRVAESLDRSAMLAPALKERARALIALGDEVAASRDLERASRTVVKMPPSPVRDTLQADLSLAIGEILLARDPERSCRELDLTVAAYEASDYRLYLPRALSLRSSCRQAQGQVGRASDDLETAIRELERQRRRVEEPADRISFFDEAREIFDQQVGLLVGRGAWQDALSVAERGRSRGMLDRLAGPQAPEPIYDRLLPRLGKTAAVLVYYQGPVDTYAWLLDHRGLWGTVLPASSRSIRDEVRRLREALAAEADSDLIAVRLERMHDLLIEPLEDRIRGTDPLYVVLDGPLHQVPLSALLDGGSEEYLFEQRSITQVPSISVLVTAAKGPERPVSRRPLVVGAPAPSGFPTLVGAESEARRVADFLPGARLAGATLTASGLMASLSEHSAFHFAGHARTTAVDPAANGLVLGEGSLLSVAEIAEADAASLELVVLSACGSARGPISGSEGMRGLAGAFLAAGAGTVVASLWDVNDETTAKFILDFYRELEGSDDPVRALGLAKRRALESGVPFTTWAAFEVYSVRTQTAREGS